MSFTFGTVIRYHTLLMLVKYYVAPCQIFSNILCVYCNIADKKWVVILFIFGTVINDDNRGLVHVKYTWAQCQKVAFVSITS